jgi:DNA-binding MarR family transcriptional regulator
MTELAGTGRHLSDSELYFWTRFHDASRLLEAELARHLKRVNGMNLADYEILVRVDGAGGRMRMGELAEQIVVSTSRLSHTIDRLANRGWIERAAVPTDRRGSEAVLTAEGRAALEACSERHAELIRDHLLSRLDERRLREFGGILDVVVAGLKRP